MLFLLGANGIGNLRRKQSVICGVLLIARVIYSQPIGLGELHRANQSTNRGILYTRSGKQDLFWIPQGIIVKGNGSFRAKRKDTVGGQYGMVAHIYGNETGCEF